MKTVSESSKTRHARRVRAVRIAWADTVKEEVLDRVGDIRDASHVVRVVLRRLVADFKVVEQIEESDVEDAVASACADRAGTPAGYRWEDYLLMRPEWADKLREMER